MKKVLALWIIMAFILSIGGCSAKPEETSFEEITENKKRAVTVNGKTITMGNFLITLPDDFSVTSSTENSASISSTDGLCYIGVFAADVSELTEEQIINRLPSQHESFMTPNATRGEPKDQTVKFGPYNLKFNLYAELGDDSIDTINMDGSFTDSWYTYTVLFRCHVDADVSGHTYSFAEFCGYSEYIGLDLRFERMQ